MAITGSGTEQDPWVVHSYDEIKGLNDRDPRNEMQYAVLANDINCNSYGSEFEWETAKIGSVATGLTMTLDLDGHTIKNILVKANNVMFSLNENGDRQSTVKNGKILNVFLNSAVGLSQSGLFKGISTSINGNGVAGYTSSGTFFENCAVYFESVILSYMPFMNYDEQRPLFKNSDILLKIDNINGKRIIGKDTTYGGSTTGLDNCRISGYIKGSVGNNIMGACTANNSVCNVDFTGCTSSVIGQINVFAGGTGGVCNTDLHPSTVSIAGGGSIIGVTSQEIVNGDALRAKGFTVVNVVGD